MQEIALDQPGLVTLILLVSLVTVLLDSQPECDGEMGTTLMSVTTYGKG